MCVPKSNSNDRYAITCSVIAYHLVHFVSIRLINKCQSSIYFIFTSERAIYSTFMKISVPIQVFCGKNKVKVMKVKLCKVYTLECQLCFRNNKICEFDSLERQTMGVNRYASTFPLASCNKKKCNHRKKNVAYKNMTRKSVHGTRMPPPIVFILPAIKHWVYNK